MHLYDCRFDTFIPQATTGEIADILENRFVQRFEHGVGQSEVKSWRNSLGAFAEALVGEQIDESWIVLEYQLPLSSARVDCMLLGTDARATQNAVLVELKQWDRCVPTPTEEIVKVGGAEMLHPSAQVRNYRQYLEDAHSAFADGAVGLSSCAYLHNLKRGEGSGYLDPMYRDLVQDSPVFCIDSVERLAGFVKPKIGQGAPEMLVDNVLRGHYCPSKKLLDYVAQAINGYAPWHLLDEQSFVFNKIMGDIEEARRTGEKKAIIVTGGPGTGKSVIAVQVVGAAAKRGYSVVHATASKAFTTNLRGIVGRSEVFIYTSSLGKAPPEGIELLVCDEAHRIRETTSTRFHKGTRPQISEVVDAAKVSVFLLDQRQSVRANEIGSVGLISDYARSHDIPVSRYDLNTQFRCAGSESYIRWVDYALGLSADDSMAWKRNNEYEFRVVDSPQELEGALKEQLARGFSARLVAGFCWPWSDPLPNGALVDDVKIGDWARPWNKKPRDLCKVRGSAERPSEHPYKIWATEEEGFSQVGCIYSAQGFEFDYVGLILGADLIWDPITRSWLTDLTKNCDRGFKSGLKSPKERLEKLQQIYRVLATRGMRGTYVYCLDPYTRDHLEALADRP